ncbi:MAG TPA: hypothetical protein VIY48_05315 [Candidatus Paceibacterota bacterium]
MSRTDVHTPYWVKKNDPAWRDFFIERHDHTRGECTLHLDSFRGCYLGDSYRGKNIHCGCGMCTGQITRRLDRRSERQRSKRLIKDGRWDEASYVNRSHLSW